MNRSRALTAILSLFVVLGWSTKLAFSHEVRPAFLEISERSDGHYDILWKRPTQGAIAVRLIPHISGGLLERAPNTIETAPDFQIRIWRNLDPGTPGMEGRTLTIEGLDQTITDTFVSMRLANGSVVQEILTPENPSVTLHQYQRRLEVLGYFTLGMQHIVAGPDHLLFVLGLLLIVHKRRMLIRTVTAFTVAHSLTLAAATLAQVRLSTQLLNALIALSILFVAAEAIRAESGRMSLGSRYPWVMAFSFGLLHGMGFATGLTSLGIGRSALLMALLLFNIGVEIGQLLFIALVLALKRSFRLMEYVWPRPIELVPAYFIGALGASWTFQYCAILFGAS